MSGTPPLFEEPKGNEQWAGRARYVRVELTPYERFMAQEALPIYRGIGVRNVRDLALAPWERMGGNGAFIQLEGTEGLSGMYVAEIPGQEALNPERHLYEELYLVIEGHGATEVWKEGSSRRQVFEWQPGSLFAPPANAWHRLFNTTSDPALILGATTAPHLMNVFRNYRFIFENPFDFSDRYDEEEDYFKPRDKIVAGSGTGRAMLETNFIPDIRHIYLPLDNQRGPGYRRLAPRLGGNATWNGFMAEYPSGVYSKAHAHASGAILVCLGGRGYTYTWPTLLGTQPWKEGKAGSVKRQDYVEGGLVSAAPGGGDWFHQHLGVAREPLRVLALIPGGLRAGQERGMAGEEAVSRNLDIQEGGYSIGYAYEDPYIRAEYQAELAEDGVHFQMPAALYEKAST